MKKKFILILVLAFSLFLFACNETSINPISLIYINEEDKIGIDSNYGDGTYKYSNIYFLFKFTIPGDAIDIKVDLITETHDGYAGAGTDKSEKYYYSKNEIFSIKVHFWSDGRELCMGYKTLKELKDIFRGSYLQVKCLPASKANEANSLIMNSEEYYALFDTYTYTFTF